MSQSCQLSNQKSGAATRNLVAVVGSGSYNQNEVMNMDSVYNIYYQSIVKDDEGSTYELSKKIEGTDAITYGQKTSELMNRPSKDNYKKIYSQVLNETGGWDFHLEYVRKN